METLDAASSGIALALLSVRLTTATHLSPDISLEKLIECMVGPRYERVYALRICLISGRSIPNILIGVAGIRCFLKHERYTLQEPPNRLEHVRQRHKL